MLVVGSFFKTCGNNSSIHHPLFIASTDFLCPSNEASSGLVTLRPKTARILDLGCGNARLSEERLRNSQASGGESHGGLCQSE